MVLELVMWLKSIPDVVWAAIIASVLTTLGVVLTNIWNKKCILLQIKHASDEKVKEREMQIKKEIYIEAAEAIAEALQDIYNLPNRIMQTDNFEMHKRLLPAMAKIHMVGTLDTVKEIIQFMKRVNQETLPLVPQVTTCTYFKHKIAELVRARDFQITYMKEMNAKIEELDKNEASNPQAYKMYSDVYKKGFQLANDEYNKIVTELAKENLKFQDFFAGFLSMCINAANNLQNAALPTILSIRKELGLPIDTVEYLAETNKVFNEYKNRFTPDTIKKIIHGQ
jgi:heme exporter protein D